MTSKKYFMSKEVRPSRFLKESLPSSRPFFFYSHLWDDSFILFFYSGKVRIFGVFLHYFGWIDEFQLQNSYLLYLSCFFIQRPLANILSTFCEFCKIVTFGKFKNRKLHFLYYNYLKNMTIYVFIVCNINVWMVHRVSEANLFF